MLLVSEVLERCRRRAMTATAPAPALVVVGLQAVAEVLAGAVEFLQLPKRAGAPVAFSSVLKRLEVRVTLSR